LTLRFWKWLLVVVLAAAIVVALRHSLRDPVDGPGLGGRGADVAVTAPA
jgi:hypothetical protein